MVLPLITIGMSVVVAQRLVAIVGSAGLGVANQTVIFMTGMMVGAGTDYAVFLISRYHDYLRQGSESDEAVTRSLTSIGKVIAASAATVAITFLGMIFVQLGILKTVGPVLGLSVAVAFLRRGDAAAGPDGARRASWLDPAATRSHPSVLAAFGNTPSCAVPRPIWPPVHWC